MLFDLRPKEKLKDLYNRREEYSKIKKSLQNGTWVAVLGKRMTGKTSLVKTYAYEEGGVYVNLLGTRTIKSLIERIAQHAGMEVKEIKLDFKVIEIRWTSLISDVFSRLRGRVIALDEVQDITSPYFLKVLKSIWDTYRDIRIIFSGSYVGIMQKLLNPEPVSPLYGRNPLTIKLSTFSRDQSIEFLRKGFTEHNYTVKEREIQEVADRLDGYVGWLTYYGHLRCVRGADHEHALKQTILEGRKTVVSELENFLTNRKREMYVKALRVIASGARWTDVKRAINANNKTVTHVLNALTSMMVVDQEDGSYWIDDPVTREAVRNL